MKSIVGSFITILPYEIVTQHIFKKIIKQMTSINGQYETHKKKFQTPWIVHFEDPQQCMDNFYRQHNWVVCITLC